MNTKSVKIKSVLNDFIVGDSSSVLSTFEDACIDLTVTSPPYDDMRIYKGYNFESQAFEAIATQLYRITKDGGVVVWVVGDKVRDGRTLTSFKQALFFQQIGFNCHDVMIYQKKNTPFMRSNAYTSSFEYMFVFSKGSPKTFNPLLTETVRQGEEKLTYNKQADGINKKRVATLNAQKVRTNIWPYAVGLGGTTCDKFAFEHPALFPEKLAQDHILSWSNPKDVVLDPMCGAGTTCKMAKQNGRFFIGIDASRDYVKLAKKRVDHA